MKRKTISGEDDPVADDSDVSQVHAVPKKRKSKAAAVDASEEQDESADKENMSQNPDFSIPVSFDIFEN